MDKSNAINTLEATDCWIQALETTCTKDGPHPFPTQSLLMPYEMETKVLLWIYFPKAQYSSKNHMLFQKEKLS